MGITVKVILILLLGYIMFIVAPAIVSFPVVFLPKRKKGQGKSRVAEQYYSRFSQRIDSANEYLSALPHEKVRITGRGNAPLCGIYYEGGFKRTAVFFHGYNASPFNQMAVQAEFLYKKGFNLLITYQRAHEESGGKYTTLGIAEQYDVLDWIRWTEQKPDTSDILIYGMSMGATAVAYASDRITSPAVKGMVLDCGFCSVYEQIAQDCRRRHLPGRALSSVIRPLARLILGVDIKKTVKPSLEKATVPMLFIHGIADVTVPVSKTVRNYDDCGAAKDKLFVQNARHTEAFLQGGDPAPDGFIKWIDKIFGI